MTTTPVLEEGPVVAIDVSPVYCDDTECRVTTPEGANLWTVYTRLASGPAFAHEDRPTRTDALILAHETATLLGVPLIYRDARRVAELTDTPPPAPVPGSFTIELGVCDPDENGRCEEAETVLAVDGFPTRLRAVAFGRLVAGRSVVEAQHCAILHGYTVGAMFPIPRERETLPRTVTDWRVGVHTDDTVDWLEGGAYVVDGIDHE